MIIKLTKAKLKKFSATEQNRIIDEWITGRLASRNRKILKAYLVDGSGSAESIAEEFDMSPDAIKKILKSGCETIMEHLN